MQRRMESMCALPWNDRPLEPFPFFHSSRPISRIYRSATICSYQNVFFSTALCATNIGWLHFHFHFIRFDSICHHHLILFPFNIYRRQCFRFGCYFVLFIIWHNNISMSFVSHRRIQHWMQNASDIICFPIRTILLCFPLILWPRHFYGQFRFHGCYCRSVDPECRPPKVNNKNYCNYQS